MDKPNINYALAYQKFRGELSKHITTLQQKIPIPTYMVEGILSSVLADVRSAIISESSLETEVFTEELEKYYKQREKDLNDEIIKIKTKDEKEEIE